MSVAALMNKTVQFTYRVLIGSDEYGQPVYDTVTSPVQCYYRFMTTDVLDSTYIETAEVQLLLHAGTQTADLELVTIDGLEYHPSGVVETEYNPRTGTVSHLALTVRRGDS